MTQHWTSGVRHLRGVAGGIDSSIGHVRCNTASTSWTVFVTIDRDVLLERRTRRQSLRTAFIGHTQIRQEVFPSWWGPYPIAGAVGRLQPRIRCVRSTAKS